MGLRCQAEMPLLAAKGHDNFVPRTGSPCSVKWKIRNTEHGHEIRIYFSHEGTRSYTKKRGRGEEGKRGSGEEGKAIGNVMPDGRLFHLHLAPWVNSPLTLPLTGFFKPVDFFYNL